MATEGRTRAAGEDEADDDGGVNSLDSKNLGKGNNSRFV